MPGIRKLRKIQIGRETTAGTDAAATTVWRGIGTIEDALKMNNVEEDVGFLSPLDRFYISSLLAKVSFESVPATYEQLPYIFEAGIKAVNTGASDGSGSDKIYAYPLATNASQTLNTYTLEGGDNTRAEQMLYSFVEGFKLTGKAQESWMISADWQGRAVTTASYTGSVAVPAVKEILFQNSKLYIDAISGTSGTTQVSSAFLAADVNVKTGVVPFWTGNGNLYFTASKLTESEVTVDVTFEYDGDATSEVDNWRAGTSRQLAIIVTGPAVTTAGTAYSAKTLKMEFSGHWDKFTKIGEQDGDDIVTGTFRARYNGTSGKYVTFTVVNELTALP